MTLVPLVGATLSAFAIWLTVRIVTRREKWAKWTAVALVAVLVGYPLSFGPACWWLSKPVTLPFVSMKARQAPAIYSPIGRLARRSGTGKLQSVINWYATLWVPKGEGVACGIIEVGDPGIVFLAK